MRVVSKIWIMLGCMLLLVACGSDSGTEAPSSDSTPPVASPTAESGPKMTVDQIVWTQSTDADTGAPADVVTGFSTESPAIIAAIEVTNIPSGTEFTATWTIDDQPIDGSDMHVSAESELPHAWVSFAFTRDADQRYPIGQLGVVITSSDGTLREGSVEIGFP